MSLKSSIITYLNTKAGVTALVGSRISWGKSGQSDVLPRIVIEQISGDHKHHMTAATGKVIGRIQISSHGATSVSASNVAEQVRLALDGFRGTMGDVFVSMCHLEDEADLDAPPTDGSDNTIYGVRQDYLIGWDVTVPTFN